MTDKKIPFFTPDFIKKHFRGQKRDFSQKNPEKFFDRRRHCLTSGLFLLLSFFSSANLLAQCDGVPWKATDALGRTTVGNAETSEIRPHKTIGLFYFLWMDDESTLLPPAPGESRPYDVTKILEQDPEAMSKPDSPLWGGNGIMHFWGEPLYGYYNSGDPWVVRRHLQLLADAGVDVLIFDVTNAVTYPKIYLALCERLHELKSEGENVPQITFMLNTAIDQTVARLWDEIYQTGQYDDLFFLWEDKPLLIADPEGVPEEFRDKFTLRRAHWPFTMVNTENAWHWVATYPQPYGWTVAPEIPEQVNVSVSQNLDRATGLVAHMSSGTTRGRSFGNNETDYVLRPDEGRNFSEQWKRAYELDPPFVMITGWNEWIAGRWFYQDRYIFVDQYNQENSRDIEPMAGGHHDNYYLQMIDGIRKYKGAPSIPTYSAPKTILINQDYSQWADVAPEFRDHLLETQPRDFSGCGMTHYQNRSGRNDLQTMKVARDAKNLYFYVRTKAPIQPENPDGLALLLNVDNDPQTGWLGGDLLIGRHYEPANDAATQQNAQSDAQSNTQPDAQSEASLEQSAAEQPTDPNEVTAGKITPKKKISVETYAGKATKEASIYEPDWRWNSSGTVDGEIHGNEMHLVIPLSLLKKVGVPFDCPEELLQNLSFKWLDNLDSTETQKKTAPPEEAASDSTVSAEENSLEASSTSDTVAPSDAVDPVVTPDDLYLNGDVAPESRFFYQGKID